MERPLGPNDNRAPSFIACGLVTTIAALTAVCLRIYVRTRIVHAVGWDDWTAIFTMVIHRLDLSRNCIDDPPACRFTHNTVELCRGISRLWQT